MILGYFIQKDQNNLIYKIMARWTTAFLRGADCGYYYSFRALRNILKDLF